MLLSRTKTQPVHYMLEIESFSVLSEDPNTKIKSDDFEVSGYNWRLDLFPNRCDEENGYNHISLYLIPCSDPEDLSDVNFYVKFFLYDYKSHNYVTFQDVGWKRINFYREKKWGFEKLMSLENFKESSNGHLFEDSCVFGVEVLLVPNKTQNDRCLSMIKPPSTTNTYSWTIDKFSSKKDTDLTSEVFKIGKVKWTLSLSPKVCKILRTYDLRIGLSLHKPDLLPKSWKVYAKVEFRFKNHGGYDDRVIETKQHWFCSSSSSYLYLSIKKLNELVDTTKGFLVNDSLTVEAKISTMGILKDNF